MEGLRLYINDNAINPTTEIPKQFRKHAFDTAENFCYGDKWITLMIQKKLKGSYSFWQHWYRAKENVLLRYSTPIHRLIFFQCLKGNAQITIGQTKPESLCEGQFNMMFLPGTDIQIKLDNGFDEHRFFIIDQIIDAKLNGLTNQIFPFFSELDGFKVYNDLK